jgi:hypothetical protein
MLGTPRSRLSARAAGGGPSPISETQSQWGGGINPARGFSHARSGINGLRVGFWRTGSCRLKGGCGKDWPPSKSKLKTSPAETNGNRFHKNICFMVSAASSPCTPPPGLPHAILKSQRAPHSLQRPPHWKSAAQRFIVSGWASKTLPPVILAYRSPSRLAGRLH